MKPFQLDPEENEIITAFENNELVAASDVKDDEYIAIAKNTQNKLKNINIRVSEKTLLKLKARAAQSGIPYQTLASSVLHRYSNDLEHLKI